MNKERFRRHRRAQRLSPATGRPAVCPKCGEESRGVLAISTHYGIVRRCGPCRAEYARSHALPLRDAATAQGGPEAVHG